VFLSSVFAKVLGRSMVLPRVDFIGAIDLKKKKPKDSFQVNN
jgi:hypothetical protein